jgi:hypothetical protein
MIGLDLDDLSVDGSITKAPCDGAVAGRNPVDRGTQATTRSWPPTPPGPDAPQIETRLRGD